MPEPTVEGEKLLFYRLTLTVAGLNMPIELTDEKIEGLRPEIVDQFSVYTGDIEGEEIRIKTDCIIISEIKAVFSKPVVQSELDEPDEEEVLARPAEERLGREID